MKNQFEVQRSYKSILRFLENCPIPAALMEHKLLKNDEIFANRRFVNKAFLNLFLIKDRIKGVNETVKDSWVNKNSLDEFNKRLFERVPVVDYEAERIASDRSTLWITLTSQYIDFEDHNLTIVWHKDITNDRWKLCAELINRDGWYWELDSNLKFTWMSDSVFAITGVPAHWHFGKSREEIRKNTNNDEEEKNWKRHNNLLKNKRPFDNFRFRREGPDGIKWMETSGEPFFSKENNFLGYRGFARDITKLVEREKSKEQDIALSTMGEMSSRIAHELNQPLNAIRIGLGNIKRRFIKYETGDKNYLEDLEIRFNRLDDQIKRAADIIENMRLFEVYRESKNTFILNDVLETVKNFSEERFRIKNIKIIFRNHKENLFINGSSAKMQQAIINIIENSEQNFELIDKKEDRLIFIDLQKANNSEALLTLEDTGGGIREESLPFIFNAFYSTKGQGEDFGHGLPISRSIIRDMGGNIIAENTKKGAKFSIFLPIHDIAS